MPLQSSVWEEKAIRSSVNKDRNIHCLNCNRFNVFKVRFFLPLTVEQRPVVRMANE